MFERFTYTTFNVNGIDINPPLAEWQTVVNPVKFEWGVTLLRYLQVPREPGPHSWQRRERVPSGSLRLTVPFMQSTRSNGP